MAFIVLLGVLFSRFIPGKTYGVPSGTEVLIHVLYLEDLLHIPFINPVYWTLCLEIQFYLVFCALMLIVTMFRRWMSSDRAFYAVLLPAMVISDLWPLHVPLYNREGLFLGHWHLFIAGVIVYGSVARPGIRYPAVIAFANLAVLAVAASLRTDKELAMGVVCALVILFADQRGKLSVWLGSRPFQILGAVSYSLYLFHNPLTGAFYRIGYRMTGRSIVWEGFWFVLATAGCVAAACFFYWIIEKPSMTLSRRIRLSP
jgi:peptidoglycan/LPS O-acetylase OafA/YrhL